MIEDLAIGVFLFIFVLYYVTVALHLFGVTMFKEAKISVRLALIPFYYWFKRDVIV